MTTSPKHLRYGVYVNGNLYAIFTYSFDAKLYGKMLQDEFSKDAVTYKEMV